MLHESLQILREQKLAGFAKETCLDVSQRVRAIHHGYHQGQVVIEKDRMFGEPLSVAQAEKILSLDPDRKCLDRAEARMRDFNGLFHFLRLMIDD